MSSPSWRPSTPTLTRHQPISLTRRHTPDACGARTHHSPSHSREAYRLQAAKVVTTASVVRTRTAVSLRARCALVACSPPNVRTRVSSARKDVTRTRARPSAAPSALNTRPRRTIARQSRVTSARGARKDSIATTQSAYRSVHYKKKVLQYTTSFILYYTKILHYTTLH